MRIEEIKNGQQEMQKRIAQMADMVTSLTKGKGITDDPSLRGGTTSWTDDMDPSIKPNSDDPCEQRLRKKLSGQSKHVDMQQRCSLLDKKLKEIEGVDNLGSVDPRELCLVPDVVISSKFKVPKFEKYDGIKCPEIHLATYCHKMVGHAYNKKLCVHVFQDNLIGAATNWYLTLMLRLFHKCTSRTK